MEHRLIGSYLYSRSVFGQRWRRSKSSQEIEPVDQLEYFRGRDATEVSLGQRVVRYVVAVPARILGIPEQSGEARLVEIAVFVNREGLPTKAQVSGDAITGQTFSNWGEPVVIEEPQVKRRLRLSPTCPGTAPVPERGGDVMAQTIIALVVLAAVVGGLFLFVWLADAKRAEKVEHDPERLDTDSDTDTDTATGPGTGTSTGPGTGTDEPDVHRDQRRL